MRGKMAQEDILDQFGLKEIFADYIIGELHCEELDIDKDQDIATSSRQSIKQDDLRFETVRDSVHSELRYIAGKWSDWRVLDGAKIAQTVPEVSTWLEGLKGDTKKKAKKWIGRLNTIRTQDDHDKKELLKSSILAFESYRRKEQLDSLDSIKDESLDQILAIFKSIDDLELSYYGQIVKLRIGVIKTLQKKLKVDQKEHAIRDYVFKHLWLLDPSWERAKGTEHAETTLKNFLEQNTKGLTPAQKNARIDIGYRTTSGKHVIIELKRASVKTRLDTLVAQIRKYRTGALKLIEKTGNPTWPLEIICLVGEPPPEWHDPHTGADGVRDALSGVNARMMFYDELLDHAQSTYSDYLEEHEKTDKLMEIFNAIDDFAPSTEKVEERLNPS